MLLFVNLRAFTVEGFKVRHQRWWSMAFYSCRHGMIRNIEVEADLASVGPNGERLEEEPREYKDIYIKNGDGIDIRCGCSDILIENITGQTEDDAVALTALKGHHETRYYVEGKGWDIHDVIIKNVISRAFSGAQLRLLCADGTRVHDVTADTLIDTSPRRAWETSVFLGDAMTEYIRGRVSVLGEMFNISLNNIHSNSRRAILAGCSLQKSVHQQSLLQKGRVLCRRHHTRYRIFRRADRRRLLRGRRLSERTVQLLRSDAWRAVPVQCLCSGERLCALPRRLSRCSPGKLPRANRSQGDNQCKFSKRLSAGN